MKIAIADRKGSYSDYWIKYCEEHDIPYKAVNPYDTDIVAQVSDCDAFMWHHQEPFNGVYWMIEDIINPLVHNKEVTE